MAAALAFKHDPHTATVEDAKAARPVLRDSKGRLLPGTKGVNPRGRPPTGLAWAEWTREIAAETHPLARTSLAQEVIRACFEVAMGLPIPRDREYMRRRAEAHAKGEAAPEYTGDHITPNLAEQMRAAEIIRAWGFRAPPQEVEVTAGGESRDFATVPRDELAKLEAELAAAVAARATAPSDDQG